MFESLSLTATYASRTSTKYVDNSFSVMEQGHTLISGQTHTDISGQTHTNITGQTHTDISGQCQ